MTGAAEMPGDLERQEEASGADLVTNGHDRLCIDCKHCTDGGKPIPPSRFVCEHPLFRSYRKKPAPVCENVRCAGFRNGKTCGPHGYWFDDALSG